MNNVASLISTSFTSLRLEEKLEIKRLGRPTPSLNICQEIKSKSRNFVRKFNPDIYNKNDWICGCSERNALFCFPCLLFGGGREEAWVKKGVTDINHLHDRIKKHENSSIHITNVLNLSILGNTNIAAQLDSSYRRTIELHNQKVTNNRYILNIIINCIRFCGSLELALRGHDESETSSNPGVFRALINFSAELDGALKSHLEKATVFKGTSKTIQNELLQCILEVCQDEISVEIKKGDYVSVIADETTDISCTFQMSIIFRYIVNGKPVERFWNFLTPRNHDAKSLASCIVTEINRHLEGDPNKLIAQTYDGANVMRGSSNGVQAIVKETFPKASYIHCHAHQLNLIMLHASSVNRNVKIFFANLQGICSFFSNSTQRTAVLDEIVKKRLPRSVQTRWNFQSRSVNTVFEYREELIECMKTLLESDEVSSNSTIQQAFGYVEMLSNQNFVFWLTFFHKIMPFVDILYNQLQKREIDPAWVKVQIECFESEIVKIRESVDELFQTLSAHENKRMRHEESEKSVRQREAKEVCDIIICEVKERFKFTGHLTATSLFLPERFSDYYLNFPEKLFQFSSECYTFLDAKKLRTELSVLYGMEQFRIMSGALGLLDFIRQNNLCDTLSECFKLLSMLVTMPMTTSEAERCFSTLKRIKTFLRNTMSQERLSALAMLSIERDFIMAIPDFNQRVIEKFASSKERRMDFLYK